MPLATNQQLVKTYGRLPWWRGPVHFRTLLKRSVETSSMIEGAKVKPLSQAPHSFATTQLDLPGWLQAKCRAWVLANVNQEDLSPLETQDDAFHITVRYGLHDPDIREVEAVLKGFGPVNIELGRVEQFEAGQYDVLIVPVKDIIVQTYSGDFDESAGKYSKGPHSFASSQIEHVGLLAIRSALSELPHTDTHPTYLPHVTLAYVQKGKGQRHVGDSSFLGDTATLDRLRYSSKEQISWVSLLPKQYAAESMQMLHEGLKERIKKILAKHPDWDKQQIKSALDGEEIEEQPEEKFLAQIEFNRPLTSYEHKVDFKALDSETKKLTSQGTDRVKQLLTESREKLLSLITSRHKAGSLTAKFILELELRGLGQLVPTLREALGAAFRLGQREASKELKKTFAQYASDFDESKHPREEDRKFASGGGGEEGSRDTDVAQVQEIKNSIAEGQLILRSGKSNGRSLTTEQLWAVRKQVESDLTKIGKSRLAGKSRIGVGSSTITDVTPEGYGPKYTSHHSYQVKLDPTGLPPEKALEFFERKAILWGADIRQPLLSEVKNILFDGIKQGTPLRELIVRIRDAYLPWLGDPDQVIVEIMLTPYRLETLVRTNVIEALNEGRKAQFQDAVDDGFVIGLVYSAVLDARTTEVCRHLDEKIFPANSPDLDRLTPPRHFNCFVDGQTAVYTAKGWKQIRVIEVGDLVLTDKGRMQPVTFVHHKQNPQKYDGEVVKITIKRVNTASAKGRPIQHFLTVTPEHPVLVKNVWIPAGEVCAGDSIACLGSPCQTCGKYVFTSVVVEKVERWKLKKARRLYNLSVLEDESYIAEGFVVHNCRSLIVPVTRLEGPVQYITSAQVAKGIELSGKGFGQDGEARQYEFNEEDHPCVAAGEEGGRFTSGGEGRKSFTGIAL